MEKTLVLDLSMFKLLKLLVEINMFKINLISKLTL